MTENWADKTRPIENVTILLIENCVYRALSKFKQEEKEEEESRYKLRQAACPAVQSNTTIRWLISLPIISTAVTVAFYYFGKKYGN